MWTIQRWQVSFDVLVILSRWEAQEGVFMLTMRFNSAQAIVEVITLTFNKFDPTIVNPFTNKFGKSSMHHNCHPIH
jgi:hypothetical protein